MPVDGSRHISIPADFRRISPSVHNNVRAGTPPNPSTIISRMHHDRCCDVRPFLAHGVHAAGAAARAECRGESARLRNALRIVHGRSGVTPHEACASRSCDGPAGRTGAARRRPAGAGDSTGVPVRYGASASRGHAGRSICRVTVTEVAELAGHHRNSVRRIVYSGSGPSDY